jgi:hypothetical protein
MLAWKSVIGVIRAIWIQIVTHLDLEIVNKQSA